MEKNPEIFARIINDVVMEETDRPVGRELDDVNSVGMFLTSGGRLKKAGWPVSTVITAREKSLAFSIQLTGGRGSYSTDILARFVDSTDENVVREYAEHALAHLLEINDWTDN